MQTKLELLPSYANWSPSTNWLIHAPRWHTAVLNDTLEDAFRTRYCGFRPANNETTETVSQLYCRFAYPSRRIPRKPER
jgi:hypothetical protein